MRILVFIDDEGRLIGTGPVGAQEAKLAEESEDILRAELPPQALPGQRSFEVEVPSELEKIESPVELQQALESYSVDEEKGRLVPRREG